VQDRAFAYASPSRPRPRLSPRWAGASPVHELAECRHCTRADASRAGDSSPGNAIASEELAGRVLSVGCVLLPWREKRSWAAAPGWSDFVRGAPSGRRTMPRSARSPWETAARSEGQLGEQSRGIGGSQQCPVSLFGCEHDHRLVVVSRWPVHIDRHVGETRNTRRGAGNRLKHLGQRSQPRRARELDKTLDARSSLDCGSVAGRRIWGGGSLLHSTRLLPPNGREPPA
jgi:hypothetical protein